MHEITQYIEIPDERVLMHDVFSTGLHQRYMYTQSECSSALSTISSFSTSSLVYKRLRSHMRHISNHELKRALAVCASFIVTSLSAGLSMIYGLLEDDFELIFGSEAPDSGLQRSRASIMIGTIQFACFFAFARLAVWSCRTLGVRATVGAGMIMTAGGLVAASYSEEIWQLCLAYGLLVGIGISMSANAAMGVPEAWGCDKNSVAALLCLAAPGVGGAVLSVLWQHLAVYTSIGKSLRWIALVCAGGHVLAIPIMFTPSDVEHLESIAYVGKGAPETMGSRCPEQVQRPDICFVSTPTAAGSWYRRMPWAPGDWRQAVGLVGLFTHSTAYLVPFILLPGYISTQLPAMHHLSGALLMAIASLCMSFGRSLARPLVLRTLTNVRPGVVRCMSRFLVSASVWCLWLPGSGNWGMAYGFCVAYGLCLGMIGETDMVDPWANMVVVAGVVVGVPVASWLLVTVGGGVDYMPAITFAAAGLLVTAVCDVATNA